MEPKVLPRHQLIEICMSQHSESIVDGAIYLWERMTAPIVLIIGEDGFSALYERSVSLAQPTFPWLTDITGSIPIHQRFAELRRMLEKQTPSQAREANSVLLLTFTGILATLIGEPLTTRILSAAWGADASHRTGKEFHHG